MKRLSFSTVATHEDIRSYFLTDAGRRAAARWHAQQGFARCYVSTYRAKYSTPAEVLQATKQAFAEEGVESCGCVCPTEIGRASNGWKDTSCFCDDTVRPLLREIFEHAARHFDRVIIDNRLFYDCSCDECARRKGDRSWSEFHQAVLTDVFEKDVIAPAKHANPRVQLILKYPSWYESLATRGYDVINHSRLFDEICVGTETRDPSSDRWGRRQPTGAFLGASWIRDICATSDGNQCPSAWFDYIACTKEIFLAQMRGSAMAGCGELIFFNYGSFLKEDAESPHAAPTVLIREAMSARKELEALHLASKGGHSAPRFIAAFRDPRADAGAEPYVFDFMAMLGLPMTLVARFPQDAPCAAFALQSIAGKDSIEQIESYIASGRPAIITSRAARNFSSKIVQANHVSILNTDRLSFPDRILRLPGEEIDIPSDALPAEKLFEIPPVDLETLRRPCWEALGIL